MSLQYRLPGGNLLEDFETGKHRLSRLDLGEAVARSSRRRRLWCQRAGDCEGPSRSLERDGCAMGAHVKDVHNPALAAAMSTPRRHVPYADWPRRGLAPIAAMGVPVSLTRKAPSRLKDHSIGVIRSQPVAHRLAASWYERGEP